ncbi:MULTISPECIES: MarR family winged helix-turn-helix transcriptional regulator [Nocardiopsidaceae]|jgi:DNA-binding MarR family transcriptional regulator|uniref:MarR family transcriptional regulator n=2 Tax=Nocardiopsidaceae TaxID=83676 RepID=A0ABY6YID0_9ACTN|nr:MarR family transcriptional regulator [Streptomonospora nanhaiensis]MEE2045994.1 MarR family transcriptional regulator [Nocardiopsis tropica]WAE72037.1 MarR family transcriptional regulator [Streptomonospora nanhaiensis]
MENAAWLDGGEQRVWRGFLRMNAWIYDELEKDLRDRTGLSLVEYGILVHLSEAPGRRMRMRVLADSVIVSKSRLSHQVARLERDGYVRREHCDDDRRGLWAVLEDEGAAVLDRAAPGHAVRVRSLVFDKLSGEQVRQLAAVIDALEGDEAVSRGQDSV